jgi:hypothetical protein
MKKERDPTREELEKLLAWFDSDREKAAVKFQSTHERLIRVFASRGCVDADSLADEVMNRVAVRIDTVIMKYPDAVRCCLAFIDNVYHEWYRDQCRKANAKPPPSPRPAEELEREDECLKQCLETVTKSDRDLFEHYFQSEKRIELRKRLALELALTANALRIRAHKIRKELRRCLVECLGQA